MVPRKLLKALDLDDIISLDFETYFDQKYSLRSQKISTSEYVRDERFKAQCVGIRSLKQRKARWYPHTDISTALADIDWSRVGLLAHNTSFDGFILSQIFNIIPKFYFCSMSMARPLFNHNIGAGLDEVAKYLGYAGKIRKDALAATKGIRDLSPELMNDLGDYCADDVDDMFSIFRDMLKMGFPLKELTLIHLTINAFANPVAVVDLDLAQEELDYEVAKKKRLITSCAKYIENIDPSLRGTHKRDAIGKVLSSNDQFAGVLRGLGVEPPIKPSPTIGKADIYAFAKNDLSFQMLQRHEDKNIQKVVEARLSVKSTIGETRARRMILRGTTGDCKLPLMLKYGGARTMRWSGGDKFNPQNFKRGGRLRKCIRAPTGYRIVVVDSSQIEARMNAWLWGQDDMLEVFANNGDPYRKLASAIYKIPEDRINYAQRFVGKVGILGLGYCMGAPKFQHTLATGAMGPAVDIPIEEAELAKNTYRRENYKIVAGWKTLDRLLAIMLLDKTADLKGILHFRKEAVDTISGLTLHYPELSANYNHHREMYQDFHYLNKGKPVKIYGGKFDENLVQHLARLVVAEQMVQIAERYRIITMTHDEVVFLAHWREAKAAYNFGIEKLKEPPKWCHDIPLNAEGGYDLMYSK